MSFVIESLRKNSTVILKSDEGRIVASLKNGSKITLSDSVVGSCSKTLQNLLIIKPPVIKINKIQHSENLVTPTIENKVESVENLVKTKGKRVKLK